MPVKEIDAQAFARKTSLLGVFIPEGVVKIGAEAFSNCYEIKQVYLPETLVSIGNHAFDDSQILEVNLADSVTEIGVECFFNVEKIHLGKGITGDLNSIMVYEWADYTSVSEENPIYSSKDGSLYSKDGSTLFRYSARENEQTVKIDGGVKTIAAHAFEGVESVKTVIIGESVESLGDEVFYGSSVEAVVIDPEKIDCADRYICDTIYSMSSDMGAFGDLEEMKERYPELKIYYYSEEDPYIDDMFWRFNKQGEIVIWHPAYTFLTEVTK